MANLKIYAYRKCSTCQKAFKWLEEKRIPYEELAIRESPPSREELSKGLRTMGSIRKLLNTSSRDYRESGLRDRLDGMAPEDVFALLQKNGNLVKRPFVVTGDAAFAGFKPEDWSKRLA